MVSKESINLSKLGTQSKVNRILKKLSILSRHVTSNQRK